MRALVLNCTLKPGPEPSNTEALVRVLMKEWESDGIQSEIVRLADYVIKPGVKTDMGGGDQWPAIHEKIQAHDYSDRVGRNAARNLAWAARALKAAQAPAQETSG